MVEYNTGLGAGNIRIIWSIKKPLDLQSCAVVGDVPDSEMVFNVRDSDIGYQAMS